MADAAEVQKAFDRFDKFMTRHGVLRTRTHDLYLGLYNALQCGEIAETELQLLGEKIRLSRKQGKQEEIKQAVTTAEEIYKQHGAKPALSYLHGELEPRTVTYLMLLRQKHPPSARLAAMQQIFGGVAPDAVDEHATALAEGHSLAAEAHEAAQLVQVVTQKTGLESGKVEGIVFKLLDMAHEKISPAVTRDLTSALHDLSSRTISNKKSFNHTVGLLRTAVNKAAQLAKQKNDAGKGEHVIRKAAAEIKELTREARKFPFEAAKAVVEKHVRRYRLGE